MPARAGSLSPSRVSLVVVVAALVVLLAALLAYEANNAAQSQRRTAERALREYATMAAQAFHDRYQQRWRGDARRALGVATTGLAVSPFDPLVSLDVVKAAAADVLPCAPGRTDSARRYVRLDLRTSAAVVEPSTVPSVERDGLIAAARRVMQRLPAPEEPYLLLRSGSDATRSFLVVGVRYVRLGAPIGLYGFTVCAPALGRELLAQVLRGGPLLPPSIAGTADNGAMLYLELRDSSGSVGRWGTAEQSAYAATVPLDDAGYSATVTLRSAAVGNMSVGSLPRSRVPLLTGLLVLTAALGAVALIQLRREHELAQMRADFTSSVSHELRTPLTQILLYGETLLLDRARTSEDRHAAAATIVQEAGRLVHLVENVLAFGRLRRPAAAPPLSNTLVAAVIAEATTMLHPATVAAGVQLVLRGDPALLAVADRAMLRQVMINLLDNAIKYGVPGTEVRVDTCAMPGRVQIAVSDAGSGVPAGERARIWIPYVRLPHRPGGSPGGTGLGLAVVRELVGLMRGRVWVDDDPATGGARFTVELEAAAPQLPGPRAAEGAER